MKEKPPRMFTIKTRIDRTSNPPKIVVTASSGEKVIGIHVVPVPEIPKPKS